MIQNFKRVHTSLIIIILIQFGSLYQLIICIWLYFIVKQEAEDHISQFSWNIPIQIVPRLLIRNH